MAVYSFNSPSGVLKHKSCLFFSLFWFCDEVVVAYDCYSKFGNIIREYFYFSTTTDLNEWHQGNVTLDELFL